MKILCSCGKEMPILDAGFKDDVVITVCACSCKGDWQVWVPSMQHPWADNLTRKSAEMIVDAFKQNGFAATMVLP